MKMVNVEKFVDAGNIKFRTVHREAMYWKLRDTDVTVLDAENIKKSEKIFTLENLFYMAFAIGYHFNQQIPIGKNAINHQNLVSLDRDIKLLMVHLILKRKGNIDNPKKLWGEVETYAEYGIKVLFNSLKDNNNILEINKILE